MGGGAESKKQDAIFMASYGQFGLFGGCHVWPVTADLDVNGLRLPIYWRVGAVKLRVAREESALSLAARRSPWQQSRSPPPGHLSTHHLEKLLCGMYTYSWLGEILVQR